MLGPNDRALLLDALRPPDGYRLHTAVGTTFSLDLHALLLPPLSFALLDWAAVEDGDPNPLALLEALRRNAERMTVFCQAGQIALPKAYRSLLVHLEPCVVEVTPPDPERIFHPKLWALKFTAGDEPPRYRLVFLSRNLTFDRAWDTVLTLDGAPATGDRRATARRNAPLQRLLERLPGLAVRPMDGAAAERVTSLATDLRHVAFDVPEGFDDVAFHVLGLGGRATPLDDADRLLVVSPFLTKGALTRLAGSGSGHVLVSRQESIDAVGGAGLTAYEQVFELAPHAWQDLAGEQGADGQPHAARDERPDAHSPSEEAVAEAAGAELTGLHAKLYVAEHRSHVRVLTGSANATDAAFTGNVEILVELATRRWRTSIDSLLTATAAGDATFRDLLVPTRPATDDTPPESPQEKVERILDRARRTLGAYRFVATADAVPAADAPGDEHFELSLHGSGPRALGTEELTTVRCWPASLGAGHAVAPHVDGDLLTARFGRVSPETLTAFFAFELGAEHGDVHLTVRFVVNAELRGAPSDRRERVLIDLLRSRSDVLRYLLFLLSDEGADAQQLVEALAGAEATGQPQRRNGWDVPLLEAMVRSLAGEPERLDHLARLIADIRRAGKADDLLPHDLDAVWEPIWQARQELRS